MLDFPNFVTTIQPLRLQLNFVTNFVTSYGGADVDNIGDRTILVCSIGPIRESYMLCLRFGLSVLGILVAPDEVARLVNSAQSVRESGSDVRSLWP